MKYFWLLMLVAVVGCAEGPYATYYSKSALGGYVVASSTSVNGIYTKDKEQADDMAEALNEAHYRRLAGPAPGCCNVDFLIPKPEEIKCSH